MWLSDPKKSYFFHWISLRLFVSIHNKTNWLTEVNVKVCAAHLKSPYPRINLSVKGRVWNRLCGFPIDSHRDVPWGTEGRGRVGKGGKKWPFLCRSWLEVSDRQSALTWPRFKPPLAQTRFSEGTALTFPEEMNNASRSASWRSREAKARAGQRGNGRGGIAASPLTPLKLFVSA